MIVLPMAGMSNRFFEAGYKKPKYMLDLHGRPVFDYALRSFFGRFEVEPILIIMRSDYGTPDFVASRLDFNGCKAQTVVLDAPTAGQAATVSLGLANAMVDGNTPLTIFNIDSFRPGFAMTVAEYEAPGYLETFVGEGEGWSFVAPEVPGATEGRAARVVEKQRISELCSTGLYAFSSRDVFEDAYAREQANPSQPLSEHYIAPIFNQLISRGQDVLFRTIHSDDVIFCGVPSEYQDLKADRGSLRRLLTNFS